MSYTITEVTRRNILDSLRADRVRWYGRLSELRFLARIVDLETLPSNDNRYENAAEDIRQHRERNDDWGGEDWIFEDARFGLLNGPDDVFLRFLCEMLHPVVCPDSRMVTRLLRLFNDHLQADRWELVEKERISGAPVFTARRLNPSRRQPQKAEGRAPSPARVFISYSHDSPDHDAHVVALSDRLRADGVDCWIDQYEESPAEGWSRWMPNQIRNADFVLVICSETYCRRFEGREEPGKGKGAKWEGAIITQEIYEAEGKNEKFIPLLLARNDERYKPGILQGATHYVLSDADGYERLYRRLTRQPAIVPHPIGKVRSMPPRAIKHDFFASKDAAQQLPASALQNLPSDQRTKPGGDQPQASAKWFLSCAMEEAADIENVRAKACIYTFIARAGAEAGERKLCSECIKHARLHIESMPEDERQNLYVEIGKIQALNGDINAAMATANGLFLNSEARDRRCGEDAHKPYKRGYLGNKALVLGSIAVAQAKAGDTEGHRNSIELLKAHADAQGEKDGDKDHDDYLDVVEAQARARDIEGAIATAKAMNPRRWRCARALMEILEAQIAARDFNAALVTVKQFRGVHDCEKVCGLCLIAEAQLKTGDNKGCKKTLKLALAAAPRSYSLLSGIQFYDECLAYSSLAGILSKAGELKAARKCVQLARSVADRREDSSGFVKERSYLRVAKAFAAIGDLAKASESIASAKRIATSSPSLFSSEADIACAQAEIGDIEGAKETAQNILHVDLRCYAYRSVGQAYARAGRFTDLMTWIKSLLSPNEKADAFLGAAEGLLASLR